MFDTAFKFVKRFVDPGLDGDVRADEPYLYGPLLSSINILSIGGEGSEPEKAGEVIGEGDEKVVVFREGAMDEAGKKVREEKGVPEAAGQRKTHFLDIEKRKTFTFEKGHTYACDFFNPYLDFNGKSQWTVVNRDNS